MDVHWSQRSLAWVNLIKTSQHGAELCLLLGTLNMGYTQTFARVMYANASLHKAMSICPKLTYCPITCSFPPTGSGRKYTEILASKNLAETRTSG